MPEGTVWDGFLDPPAVLEKLGLSCQCRNVAGSACGHGTLSIPAARAVTGRAFAPE